MKRLKIKYLVLVAWATVQSVTAFAKNVIPEEFQLQCAQYVAVRYTDVYVKSLKTDSLNVEKYLQKFPNVDSWSLDDTENFARYFDWFADTANHFSVTNKNLLTSIQPKKNIGDLLNIENETFNNICKSIRCELRTDILLFVDKNKSGNVDRNKSDNSLIMMWLFGVMAALVVFAVVLVVLFFFVRNKLRDYIVQIVCRSGRIAEKFGRKNEQFERVNANNNFPDYQGEITQLKREIEELKGCLQRIEKKIEKPQYNLEPKPIENKPQKLASEPQPSQSEQVVYVRNYQLHSGLLKVLEDSSSAEYKILLSKGGNGKFEFCGNVQEALQNSDAVFDTKICDLKGKLPTTANRVQTTEKGEAIFDGKFWKVTKPIVITLS